MERSREFLDTNEVEQLDTLRMLAGIDDDATAIRYLEMAAWNVEQACNLYFEYGSNAPGGNQGNNPPANNNPYGDFNPADIPDIDAPPQYQPMQNELQGGGWQDPYAYGNMNMPPVNQGPMPEFTPEQMDFYRASTNKDKGLGGMISDGFKSIASS